jgi:hypothetical protein
VSRQRQRKYLPADKASLPKLRGLTARIVHYFMVAAAMTTTLDQVRARRFPEHSHGRFCRVDICSRGQTSMRRVIWQEN